MLKALHIVLATLVGATLLLGGPFVAYAASTTTDGIAQSYQADTTIRQGMIVGTKPSDTNTIEPLSTDTVNNMLGVAISASDAPISLTNGSSGFQVYVATAGHYNVLVSDQNGTIHKGDFISISSLNGIGMKALDSEPIILGPADADMTKADVIDPSVQVKKSDGSTATVAIASIPVTIGVGMNPRDGHGTGNLPGFLQIASSAIAAKPVSSIRVYSSLAVLIATICISSSLLVSGVRNGITSIGRNPLAKTAIVRGLLQVTLVAMIVFILGVFAVYLLLRL